MGSLSIPNLVPGKKYALQIRSVSSTGVTSSWSETVTFTSPEIATRASNNLTNIYTTTIGTSDIVTSGLLKSANFNGTTGTDGKISVGNEGTAGWAIDYTGYGVFNNVLVRGNVQASSGKIGGWTIGTNDLYYGGTGTARIYIGAGNWANADTSFYVEQSGKFSLGAGLSWDPTSPATLSVNGILRGYINQTTAAPTVPSGTMGVGLYNSSNSSDGIYGVGLKINTNNYWFGDGNTKLKFGTTTKYVNWDGSNLEARATLKVATTSVQDLIIGIQPSTSSGFKNYSGIYLDSDNYWLRSLTGDIAFGFGSANGDSVVFYDGNLTVSGGINATNGYLGGDIGWLIGSDGILSSGESTAFVGLASSSANVEEYVSRSTTTLRYIIDDEFPDYYDPSYPSDFYDYGTIYIKMPVYQPAFSQFKNTSVIDPDGLTTNIVLYEKYKNVMDALIDNTFSTSTGWVNSGYNTSLLNNRKFTINNADVTPWVLDTTDAATGYTFATSPTMLSAIIAVPSITVTNYIGNGSTTVVATVSSTADIFSGDIIKISGATGTQQANLNGIWTVQAILSTTTFAITVSSTIAAGTYTTGLGTTTRVTKNITYTTDFNHSIYNRAVTNLTVAPTVAISTTADSQSSDGSYITYTTTSAHGINEGDTVTITGIVNTTFNLSSATVYDVPTTTTFRVKSSAPGSTTVKSYGGAGSIVTKNNHVIVSSATGIYPGMMVNSLSGLKVAKYAMITAASQSGTTITYTANNDLVAGDKVTIYGLGSLNFDEATVATATTTNFTVTSTISQTLTDTISSYGAGAVRDATYVVSVNSTDVALSLVPVKTTATISSTSGTGSVMTYNTSAAHGLITGNFVTITGLSIAGYNVSGIISVTSATAFTITGTATGNTTTSGTVTLSPAATFSDTTTTYGLPNGVSPSNVNVIIDKRRTYSVSNTQFTISIPSYKINTVSGNGSVVTYTTTSPHSFKTGDYVQVSEVVVGGSTSNGYNSTTYFQIASVPNSTTFTVNNTTTSASPTLGAVQLYAATGTVTGLDISGNYSYENPQYLWIEVAAEEALSGAFKLHQSVTITQGGTVFAYVGGTEGDYTTTGSSVIPLAKQGTKTYIMWAGSENPVASNFNIDSSGNIAAKQITVSSTDSNNGLIFYETNAGERGRMYFDAPSDSLYINSTAGKPLYLNSTGTGGSTGGVFTGNIVMPYSNWNTYGVGSGGAAIYNDSNAYKKLMIVGNNSAGGVRQVGLWDDVIIYGDIYNNSGSQTAHLQTLNMDAAIYGSSNIYNYDVGSVYRTLQIDDSSAGYRFGTTSSTRRKKTEIENVIVDDEKIEDYLSISPVRFHYKSKIEEWEENGIDWSNIKKHIGFIAEDFQELGFYDLIGLDEEGIADYFAYDRMPVYNFIIIKKQHQKIKELEARLAALENK